MSVALKRRQAGPPGMKRRSLLLAGATSPAELAQMLPAIA